MKRGYVPVRTCRGCGRRAPQEELVRLVVVNGTVQEDACREIAGRGVYCCRDAQCRTRLGKNKKMLRRAFRLQVGYVTTVRE